ncbi:hypothetical protein ACO0QE_004702 [Hanseniaspora vineae]
MNNSYGKNSNMQQTTTTIVLSSIPFDQTEEQILDLCSTVGPVKSLKMIFDPLSGRSKGTCYIEYNDLKSSASAVRNLNGYQLGGRTLKCRYADSFDPNVVSMKQTSSGVDGSNAEHAHGKLLQPKKIFTINGQVVTPESLGTEVNTTMTTAAMMLSSTISTFTKKQQFHFLQLLKQESDENTGMTLKLLKEFPQLSYAVAEILLTNGLTDVEELTKLAIAQEEATDVVATDSMDGFAGEDVNGNNNKAMSSHSLKEQQVQLLRRVLQLSDAEISLLPQDEKVMVYDLKQKAMRGDFGLI